jgi:hypothetical protein
MNLSKKYYSTIVDNSEQNSPSSTTPRFHNKAKANNEKKNDFIDVELLYEMVIIKFHIHFKFIEK